MPRKNPLPSYYELDRETYADLIRRACGCSAAAAEKLADAFPLGTGLMAASPRALTELGAKPAQAKRLHAALELARYAQTRSERRYGLLTRPKDVVRYIHHVVGHEEQESFVAIFLDARQRVIDARRVAQGSLSQVDVHPRELFRDAIRMRAHSIILAHNHPSGDPEPSEADIELTGRMREVGELVGIPVLDHVIVAPADATSMAAAGLIP